MFSNFPYLWNGSLGSISWYYSSLNHSQTPANILQHHQICHFRQVLSCVGAALALPKAGPSLATTSAFPVPFTNGRLEMQTWSAQPWLLCPLLPSLTPSLETPYFICKHCSLSSHQNPSYSHPDIPLHSAFLDRKRSLSLGHCLQHPVAREAQVSSSFPLTLEMYKYLPPSTFFSKNLSNCYMCINFQKHCYQSINCREEPYKLQIIRPLRKDQF